jgi:hypothetical protein
VAGEAGEGEEWRESSSMSDIVKILFFIIFCKVSQNNKMSRKIFDFVCLQNIRARGIV